MAKAVVSEGIWKEYKIKLPLEAETGSLKEILDIQLNKVSRIWSRDHKDIQERNRFFALKDITFSIEHGESVGILGRNGAGKSTLLKLISRITRPSKGRMTIYERVNSLLEIGTGFHSDLSGRDNVYLNGSFLGMRNSDIRKRFDDIVEFAEIGQFIETPVKYYSSGMYVRLAFSVAVHLSPELLLLDEVLAVGDTGFQQKSREKMKSLLGSGATILFVSHDLDAMQEVCRRVIWLDHGEIRLDASASQVLKEYKSTLKLE